MYMGKCKNFQMHEKTSDRGPKIRVNLWSWFQTHQSPKPSVFGDARMCESSISVLNSKTSAKCL